MTGVQTCALPISTGIPSLLIDIPGLLWNNVITIYYECLDVIQMVKATYKLIRLFDRKIQDAHIQAYSAQAAFFIIISFFPFIMLLFSIIKYFPITEDSMLELFSLIFPSGVNSMVVSIVTQIYDTTVSGTLIPITAITTLWSAGKSFLAIMREIGRASCRERV